MNINDGHARAQDLSLPVEAEIDNGVGPTAKIDAADERHAVRALEGKRRDHSAILEVHGCSHAARLAFKRHDALAGIRHQAHI